MGRRFFDLNRRYETLDEKGEPLVAIAAIVLFDSFRPKLQAAPIKRRPSRQTDIFRGALFSIAITAIMCFAVNEPTAKIT